MSASSQRRWKVLLRKERKKDSSSLDLREVVVAFAHTRTRIVAVYFGDPSGYGKRLEMRDFVGRAEWPAPASWTLDEPPELRVVYSGEPPRLVQMAWQAEGAPPEGYAVPAEAVPFAGPVGDCEPLWNSIIQELATPVELLARAQPELIKSSKLDAEQVFAAREQAVDDRAAAAHFFLRLDRATHPGLIGGWPDSMMTNVGYKLSSRLTTRRLLGVKNRVPSFASIDPLMDIFGERQDLQTISTLMRILLEDQLAAAGKDSLLDWAFELFATDCLAVSHRDKVPHGALKAHGAPNGTFFLQFAELACYALDNDVDTTFWRRHLVSFVRTAHVFLEHAVEQGITGSYPFPSEAYAYRPGRSYPRVRLEALRVEYEDRLGKLSSNQERQASLEDSLTSMVSQALDKPGGSPTSNHRPLAPANKVELHVGGVTLPLVP